MDFIRLLPPDGGRDCILTITDCLGADIQIVPTHMDCDGHSSKDLAMLFFNHWFCENGLPTKIVSDWDKLFVSHF